MTEDLNAGPKVNREFKNSVFTLLFDDEEAMRDISGTVGPILGKKVDSKTKIKKTTLQNVFLGGKINDLSFVLDDKLIVLIEHQSTINENMPLRMLHYISETYNHLYNKKDLYRKDKILIPKPVFIVLYNGEEDFDDYKEYWLSDSFYDIDKSKEAPRLELVVYVRNINKGHNVEFVGQSPLLIGYVAFVEEVRKFNKETENYEKAMVAAVENCIKKGILTDFLNKHKKEVVKMLVAEWDYEIEKEVVRDDERRRNVRSLFSNGYSVESIAKGLNLDINEVKALLDR